MTSWSADLFVPGTGVADEPVASAPATSWRPDSLLEGRPMDSAPAPAQVDLAAQAYELGFEEGRQEGERAERSRLRTAMKATEEALEVIAANEARWDGAMEENIAALAIAVARHVLDRELSIDTDVVTGLVKRALTEFPIDQPVTVRLNPNDLAALQSAGDPTLPGMRDVPVRVAIWTPDTRILAGGCVIEGRERIVDGRVDTALERAYRRLAHVNA
jgi:flagellar biosynthesis/type III secretory pathway protein FliH